jgi:alpha-galactosidase
MDEETGVIARSARIENRTTLPLTIEEVFAATRNLDPSNDYQLRYLTGRSLLLFSVGEEGHCEILQQT